VSWLPGGLDGEKPVVSWGIVGICVAVYLVQWLVGVNAVAGDFGMQPIAIGLGGEWYRLLTSIFLHGSILHLLFNMYVLVALGPTLERVLGHLRFLVLFLLSGLGGAALSYALSSPMTVSVGASGAIFGLMGALVVAGRRLRYDITMVVALIAINLVIGFVFGSGIDWRAHVGGLATGAALAAVMVVPHGRRAAVAEWGGVAAISLALVAVIALRTVQIAGMVG
jgi:membrane associated rhomboid family serine protease